MKRIRTNELYRNLGAFLKDKGIELTEGPYAQGIQKSCGLLTDVVNLSQRNLERARTKIDAKLEAMRQVIHEKTAPKPPPAPKAGPARPRKATGSRKARPRVRRG